MNYYHHPAGTARPSCHDDNLTKKIKSACGIMGIRVLDHIIVIPKENYYNDVTVIFAVTSFTFSNLWYLIIEKLKFYG